MRRTVLNAGLAGILASCAVNEPQKSLTAEQGTDKIEDTKRELAKVKVYPREGFYHNPIYSDSPPEIMVETPAEFRLSRVDFNSISYFSSQFKTSPDGNSNFYKIGVPQEFFELDEGEHLIRLHFLRNGQEILMERNFLIDKTPPAIEATSLGNDDSGRFVYDIKVFDNYAGKKTLRLGNDKRWLLRYDPEILPQDGNFAPGDHSTLVMVVSDSELKNYSVEDASGNEKRGDFDF